MKRKGPDPKEQRRKKPKDMPRRPLSAYNLFFRAERETIIDKYEAGEHQADFEVPSAPKGDDPKLIKAHNAAVFQAVARTIANRWKNLPHHKRTKFEEQAAVEMKKYRSRMVEYEQYMIKNSKITQRNEERLKQGVNSLQEKRPEATAAHPNPLARSNPAFSTSTHDRSPLVLPSPSVQGLPFSDGGVDLGSVGRQQLTSQMLYVGNNTAATDVPTREYSRNLADRQIPTVYPGNTLEALERLREGTMSHSAFYNPGFASQNVFSTPQNVQGLMDGSTNQDYFGLEHQLQLERDLQHLARFRAQEQGAIPDNLSGIGHLASASSPIAGPHLASLMSNTNSRSALRYQGSMPISDSSGTSSSQAALSATDELQFLRAQVALEREQRLRNEAILRQQQQRNDALERLLRGATDAAAGLSDNSNGSSSRHRDNNRRF